MLVLSLAVLAPTPAFPQPAAERFGVISGRVLDAVSREPLDQCNVMIEGLNLGAHTNADGTFVIRFVPPGTYRLILSRITHSTLVEGGLAVEAGKLLSRTFMLEPGTLETEPIVVTATRKEQTIKMAPASVMIVNADDIENRQRTTFDQTIESVPGLIAFRSNPSSVQSLSVRGSSDVAGGGVGNRVLLLIDGRPALMSDSGGAFWTLIPTNFIDRVEVVKGAFSSLYGSTAMGGVVNVITRRPNYKSAAQLDLKLGYYDQPAGIRYTGETPLQSELIFSYSGAGKRVSYLFSASRKQSDGHAQGTSFEFYDLYTKMLFDLRYNRNLELTLGGGRARNDYPHTWLDSAHPLNIRAKYTDDRQEKNYVNADLLYWAIPNEKLKYSSRFYFFDHDQLSFFNENDPLGTLPGNESFGMTTEIYGTKIGSITQIDYYSNERNYVVVGADVQIDAVKSAPDSIMYGNHQINNYAVFVQDEIDIAPSVSATVGGRYDWNHLVGYKTHERFSPKIAVVWSPASQLSLRGLYGQAFRAPTIAELFFRKEIAGGIDFVPNPGLAPERMNLSLETGFRWNPWSCVVLDAAIFYYEYKDLIYWESISDEVGVTYPLFQVRNLNASLMKGAELTLQGGWRDHLKASANYTYLDAEDRSRGRTNDLLAYRPRHSCNIELNLAWLRYSFHADVRYRSAIDEVFLYPLQAPDAFWLTNANVRYRLTKGMLLSLTVNNVFDTQYEELARYRMPGRNAVVGVSFRM
ncbi:MAG: TonB-dependent receptor [Chitinivibrionia bacterium]|nr:TonB-dependent receptor [Chitinivibrionia bacterium]